MRTLYSKRMSLGRLVRALALSFLAVMLVLRVGPVCEAVAVAAAPIAAADMQMMAGCDQPVKKPIKGASSQACIGGCIAVDPHPSLAATTAPAVAESPIMAAYPHLEGHCGGPAPPPPRAV